MDNICRFFGSCNNLLDKNPSSNTVNFLKILFKLNTNIVSNYIANENPDALSNLSSLWKGINGTEKPLELTPDEAAIAAAVEHINRTNQFSQNFNLENDFLVFMKGGSSYRTIRDEVENLDGKDIQFMQNKIFNSSLFALVDNCMINDQIVNCFFNYLN